MLRKKIAFFIPENIYLLNFAGPFQVFQEAINLGAKFELVLFTNRISMAENACFNFLPLNYYKNIELSSEDYIVISGKDKSTISDKEFHHWLLEQHFNNLKIVSICTGAFVLGYSGLLNDIKCTTHWKYLDMMQKAFPKAKVIGDQIYIKDKNIYTSAGVSSGIDLALSIVEEECDSKLTYAIARELVLYFRRSGAYTQKSIYLDHRNHINTGIHNVQDYILSNINKKTTQAELAEIANMSVRNLTRVFKKTTGVSINSYVTEVRLEKAQNLLSETDLTIDAISNECGFDDSTQLRRIWSKKFKKSPSHYRDIVRC